MALKNNLRAAADIYPATPHHGEGLFSLSAQYIWVLGINLFVSLLGWSLVSYVG